MNNMANVMYDLDRKEEALEMFKEALSSYEIVFGGEYKWAVYAKRRIATISEELGMNL